MLESRFIAEDQRADDLVVLTEHAELLLGLRRCGEFREVSEIAENDGDFLPVALHELVVAGRNDELG